MAAAMATMRPGTIRPGQEHVQLFLICAGEVPQALVDFLQMGLVDINTTDEDGQTALHVAAGSNAAASVDMTLLLLKAGAYIHARTLLHRLTPLHCAALRGHIEVVRLLLSFGARTDMENSMHMKPLGLLSADLRRRHLADLERIPSGSSFSKNEREFVEACQSGNEENVLIGLDRKIEYVDLVEENTLLTPLMKAVNGKHDHIIQVLLVHQADVFKRDREGYTALHHAAVQGRSTAAQLLLTYGAHVHVVELSAGFAPLHIAVARNHILMVDTLVQWGSNVNLPNLAGYTPLHMCARSDNLLTMLDKLISCRNINVNAKCFDGSRPLHEAIRRSDISMVESLIKKGKADVNATTNSKQTALHEACMEPSPKIVQVILQHGFEPAVDARNEEGNTPLHIIMTTFARRVAEDRPVNLPAVLATLTLLFQHLANPNLRNNADRVPLMYLHIERAQRDQSIDNQIAQVLVQGGADPNVLRSEAFVRGIPAIERQSIPLLVDKLRMFQHANASRLVPSISNQPPPAYTTVAPIRNAAPIAQHMDAFRCPLCSELLMRPCNTRCGHTCCQPCLHDAILRQKNCPTCQAPLQSPNNLTINAALQATIELSFPEQAALRLQSREFVRH